MVKLLKHAGRHTGRYIVLAALTTTLVACGGSSGDTDLDSQDLDGDGIPNSEDPDADNDGILDIEDEFVDLDSDGFDDLEPLQDLDNDGIPDQDDEDADGDGLLDAGLDDKFVDINQDGLDDLTGEPDPDLTASFPEVTTDAPCGGEAGTDANSSNASWDDNCLIRRSDVEGEGQFADSLYAAGVQRVVWCAGHDGNSVVDSYTAFADGEYGPSSEAALKKFQAADPNPIGDDGQVGQRTWAKLQAAIVRLAPGELATNADGTGSSARDSYGFEEGRCADIVLFYQDVTLNAQTQEITEGGWRLAKNAPNTADSVPFSIALPFGQLD